MEEKNLNYLWILGLPILSVEYKQRNEDDRKKVCVWERHTLRNLMKNTGCITVGTTQISVL